MNKEKIDMVLIHILPKDLTEVVFNFYTDFCGKCLMKQRFCYDCFYFICDCKTEKKCSHCKLLICNCVVDKVFKICNCCENYLCDICLEKDRLNLN